MELPASEPEEAPRIVVPGIAVPGPKYGLREETLAEKWDELLEMAQRNHVETGTDAEFDPDKEKYLELEKLGFTRVYTLRSFQTEQLLGYALFTISSPLHYRTEVWAMQDTLYVSPPHRGVTAARFILAQDVALEAMGVKAVYRHVVPSHDYAPLLERFGYVPRETAYLRRLGPGSPIAAPLNPRLFKILGGRRGP